MNKELIKQENTYQFLTQFFHETKLLFSEKNKRIEFGFRQIYSVEFALEFRRKNNALFEICYQWFEQGQKKETFFSIAHLKDIDDFVDYYGANCIKRHLINLFTLLQKNQKIAQDYLTDNEKLSLWLGQPNYQEKYDLVFTEKLKINHEKYLLEKHTSTCVNKENKVSKKIKI